MKIRAGVDIGGTKIRTGIIDPEGNILSISDKIYIKDYANAIEIIAAAAQQIKQQVIKIPNAELQGVGIGCPGPLDALRTKVLETLNLKKFINFPIIAEFEKHFDVPVKMNNDANVYVFGEAIYGAGKGLSLVYGMTLGTGFGHGLVIAGKIIDGANGIAAEYGIVPHEGGIIEDFVSGRGLQKFYQNRTGQIISGEEIFKLAKSGDQTAQDSWSEFGRHLGHIMISIVLLVDPQIVILGGSIADGFDYFKGSMFAELHQSIWDIQKKNLQVVKGTLGDSAPIIGAAGLV